MKEFITKVSVFSIVVILVIVIANYFVDCANIFHTDIIDDMVVALNEGNIIESSGDLDEGIFQEKMISRMNRTPETVIMGSSHIMYGSWEFDDYYIAGLSGAYLGDYYSLVGLLEYNDRLPDRVVIGVDPWAFMTDATSGRHTSIKNYAEYEMEILNGGETRDNNIRADIVTSRKIKELFSFSYFQASIKALFKNGLKYYLQSDNQDVIVCSDSKLGEKPKIMPNGRRIFALEGLYDVEYNNGVAKGTIESGSIYQLGTGFSEVQMLNLEQFDMLINHLIKEGIDIEFYLHPWYPSVYKFFEEDANFFGVLKVEEHIRELARKYGIEVHGSYNSELTGVGEEDFADWLHLKSEKVLETYNVILDEGLCKD